MIWKSASRGQNRISVAVSAVGGRIQSPPSAMVKPRSGGNMRASAK